MQEYRPRRRPRGDEDDEGGIMKYEPFQVTCTPIAMAYKVKVDETFEDSRQFDNLVSCLDQAGQNDVVQIDLTTNGGSLAAVLPVMAAMANTNAQVYVHAVSDVASAGTFLLMLADDVFINPYVTIMFHQVSFGAAGIGHHVEDKVNHTVRTSKSLLREMYEGFFSEAEMEAMLAGKEYWLDKEEFDQRYAAREAWRAKAMEALQQTQAAPAPQKTKKKPGQPAPDRRR
jgi:ATP-dependent protease ClpP protease subunit